MYILDTQNIFNLQLRPQGDKTVYCEKWCHLHCTARQLVRTTSISWVCLQQYSECHYRHYTFFPIRVIIQTSQFIWAWLCICMCPQLCHRPQWATPVTPATHSQAQHWYQTSAEFWWPPAPDSKLEAKYLSRLNISIQLSLQRNFQTSSLAHMKSLHTLAPIQSPYDSTWLPSSTPGILCLNVGTSIPKSISESNSTYTPTPHYWRQPKFKISDILDTKIDNWCHCKLQYFVRWMGYEGTDEETFGSMPMSSEMLLNLLRTFTWPTHPSQALSQIFEVQTTSLLLKFSHLLQVQQNLIIPSK